MISGGSGGGHRNRSGVTWNSVIPAALECIADMSPHRGSPPAGMAMIALHEPSGADNRIRPGRIGEHPAPVRRRTIPQETGRTIRRVRTDTDNSDRDTEPTPLSGPTRPPPGRFTTGRRSHRSIVAGHGVPVPTMACPPLLSLAAAILASRVSISALPSRRAASALFGMVVIRSSIRAGSCASQAGTGVISFRYDRTSHPAMAGTGWADHVIQPERRRERPSLSGP
jgi:hypothetical protein